MNIENQYNYLLDIYESENYYVWSIYVWSIYVYLDLILYYPINNKSNNNIFYITLSGRRKRFKVRALSQNYPPINNNAVC